MSDWTPNLPTSGEGLSPVHWHNAGEGTWQDDGVTPATLNGHVVGRWDDIINSDHVSQEVVADKPLYIPGLINGEPALLFSGPTSGFYVGRHLQGPFTNGGNLSVPYTAFVVAKLDSAALPYDATSYWALSGTEVNTMYMGVHGDTPTNDWGISSAYLCDDDYADDNWNILTGFLGDGQTDLWVSGDNVISCAHGSGGITGLSIGAYYNGQQYWKGYIAEVILYPSELSVEDMDQVNVYLRDKYDLDYTRIGGSDLLTGIPDLGTPTLSSVGIDTLSANDLVTGAPILGNWKPSYGTDGDGVTPAIWLRADMGIVLYPDTDRVYQWHNQGDAGSYFYNAYNPGSLPLFCDDPEDQMKGNPVVRGDGKSLRQSHCFGMVGDVDLTVFIAVNNHIPDVSLPASVFQMGVYYSMYGGTSRVIQFGRHPTLGPRVWYPGYTQGGEYYDLDTDAWTESRIIMWQRQIGDLWADGEYFQDGFEIAQESTVNPTRGPLNLVDDYRFRGTWIFTGSLVSVPAYIDIAEVLVYNAFLSEADREQVELYLSTRYLELEYNLATDDVVTGAPVLGTPTLYQDELEVGDLTTGAPDLGQPTLWTESIWINGVGKGSYLVSSERTDEYCSPGIKVNIVFDTIFDVNTWESVVLYEDGFKLFTGTVSRIETNRSEQKTFVVQAKDGIRRLHEYFVVEEHTSMGESIQYWISFFATLAGCGAVTYTDYGTNPNTLDGMTMGRMFAYEIIDELLLYAGLDIWCDIDNNLIVGTRMDTEQSSIAIAAGDNLSSIVRSRDSEPCRNAAMIYTVLGTAYVNVAQDWQIDNDDLRTMVVSSIYVNTIEGGEDLARRMVEAAGPEYDIKRTILDDLEPDLEVGDLVPYDDGEDNSGTGHVTTIISRQTGSEPVKELHVTLDERCPKIGAGGLALPDGRDVTVGTYDFGVWRCRDIWASHPHWEPMNTGLTSTLYFEGVNMGGTFKVDWFIRDPYYPSSMAFLLTKSGLMQTASLEPGYENWTPVLMNSHIGAFMGDSWANWQRWHIVKIRSTVASEGKYFIAATRKSDLFGFRQTFVGMTTQRFANFSNCLTPWGPGVYAYSPLAETCGSSMPYRTCMLWGNHPNNYGYEKYADLGSWHRGKGNNAGGFAGWHRHGNGCSVSGAVSGFSSNGGPEWWNCRESIDPDTGIIELQTPFSESKKTGSSPPGPCTCVKRGPTSSGKFEEYVVDTGCYEHYWGGGPDALNANCPGLHIPYDQVHNGDGSPSKIFYHPGWIQKDGKRYPSLNQLGPIILPWDVCNTLQGSFASHGGDINKMYAFSPGATTRFAISDDGGDTWEEKASIPVETSCYSGFPTSSNKVYAGMHPKLGFYNHRTLLYVSWDRGDTWADVTGDLWTEAARLYPTIRGGNGPSGIVTIAPRYSK